MGSSKLELQYNKIEALGKSGNEGTKPSTSLFITFLALKTLNSNFEVLEKNMAGVGPKPLNKIKEAYKIGKDGGVVSGSK